MWAIVEEMVDSWRVCWSHRRGKQREPTVFLFAFIPELWMVVQKLVRSSAWQHFRMFVCLFVCLFVYLLDVDSWYCSGESVGHRLGNIANQWKNIVCSAAAAQYSVMQLGGRTL